MVAGGIALKGLQTLLNIIKLNLNSKIYQISLKTE